MKRPNKKKIREIMIHATNSVRIAIDAGNAMRHSIIFCTASLIVKVKTF
jgi:hypothetical protein